MKEREECRNSHQLRSKGQRKPHGKVGDQWLVEEQDPKVFNLQAPHELLHSAILKNLTKFRGTKKV